MFLNVWYSLHPMNLVIAATICVCSMLFCLATAGDLFTSSRSSFSSSASGGTRALLSIAFMALTAVDDDAPATSCGVFACNASQSVYGTPVRYTEGWCYRSHPDGTTLFGSCAYGALLFRTDAALRDVVEQFKNRLEIRFVTGSGVTTATRVPGGRWSYCALAVVDDDSLDGNKSL
jgi:hypothetical protein